MSNITHIPVHDFYNSLKDMFERLTEFSINLDADQTNPSARHGKAELDTHLGFLISELEKRKVIPKKATAQSVDTEDMVISSPINKEDLLNSLIEIAKVFGKGEQTLPPGCDLANFNLVFTFFLNQLGLKNQYEAMLTNSVNNSRTRQ